MSHKDFQWPLEDDESIVWQGRPAPRCYTFRHWLQATIGTILFLACSFWLMVGVQLVRSEGHSQWLILAPSLLVIGAFIVGPGQLIVSRWRWGKIFYLLTDQRLLVKNKLFGIKVLSFKRNDFKQFKRKEYGRNLLSLRLSFKGSSPVVLECLEHADNFIHLLVDQDEENQPEESI